MDAKAPDAPTPVHLPQVIDGLATNPALPPAMIRRLFAWRHGEKAGKRPDLTEDMIAEIIDIDDRRLIHALARNRQLPDRFQIQLAGHPDMVTRAALAVSATAPRQVFELLIDDPERQVREELARNRHTPPDLRARLATDPDVSVRSELARYWTQAPEEVRRKLLTDPEPWVRRAACSTYFARTPHPIPPADLVPALLADPMTRAGAVIHAVLDPDTLRTLAEDPDSDVRGELARHPDLPPEVRDALAVDPSLSVRVKVFARPDTPESLRAQIYAAVHKLSRPMTEPSPAGNDNDNTVNDDDDEAAYRCLENSFASTELRILQLDWVTADPLPHLDSPYVCFRVSAAGSKTLPAEAVARLLDDEDERVRLTMAETAPHLVDPDRAESIERRYRPRQDKFTLWWDEAQILTFSPQTLRRFATDPEARLRCFAPRDPDLPPEVAAKLAADPEPRVRRAVASHRNLPLPALLQLLADSCEQVAEAAAASPHLSVEHMEQLLALAGI